MRRTYLDAGVLIAALRRDPDLVHQIDGLLADPDRAFVSSVFLRLEVLPKAVYHKRAEDIAWFEAFFASVVGWVDATPSLIDRAEREARRHGLNALDALHIAAAIELRAEELITTERPTKPIYRATGVAVTPCRTISPRPPA
jgi:hypothetical protein